MRNIDSDTALRVTDALLKDSHTQDAAIDVSSAGGVVTLSGTVSSNEVRRAAEAVARRQEGVVTVINDLLVRRESKNRIRTSVTS